jgi:hypothetical protein
VAFPLISVVGSDWRGVGEIAGYRIARENLAEGTMQHPCLFIGGNDDGLTHPMPDGAESLQWPVGITGRETYNRATLSLGDVSAAIYIHESLTPEQALNRLVEHYKAWCVNRPGGRR